MIIRTVIFLLWPLVHKKVFVHKCSPFNSYDSREFKTVLGFYFILFPLKIYDVIFANFKCFL